MTPETVDDLIRRVEAATGPDRELDARIKYAVHAGLRSFGSLDAWLSTDTSRKRSCVPEYTASIDAALALVERVLPGCQWIIGRQTAGASDAKIGSQSGWSKQPWTHAATPPLAILAALLRATRSTDA